MGPAAEPTGVPDGALYVYGIVSSEAGPAVDDAPSVEPGARVEIVGMGDVAVVVSRVSEHLFAGGAQAADDLSWLEAPVRAHEEVLERALAAGPVIPMRFGTVVAGDGSLRRYVDDRRGQFVATLRDLAGKREWGVKAVLDEVCAREQLASDANAPSPSNRSEGAAYLARKRAERDAAERLGAYAAAVAAQLHAAFGRLAERAATLSATSPPAEAGRTVILNGAYLVRDEAEDAFRATVVEQAERYGDAVGLVLTGPWPPYSFVDGVEP